MCSLYSINKEYFSINYADVAIRWGLYESALRYVGWPIVPGFDLSGVVKWAGSESGFSAGEEVFGFSMFGSYSSRIIVPGKQIRKLPKKITLMQGAALSAVAATALHALALSGGWPKQPFTANKAGHDSQCSRWCRIHVDSNVQESRMLSYCSSSWHCFKGWLL